MWRKLFNWSPGLNGIHWCWISCIIMHQFLFNYLFSGLMFLCVGLSITIRSFFFTWVFVEATVFFTIPLLIFSRSREGINTESVIIYFIYQAVARILIMAGFLRRIIDSSRVLIMVGIIVKLGIFPFHVWVLPVLKGCSLWAFLVLLIPVKLPIYNLSFQWFNGLRFFILLRVGAGVVLAMNQRDAYRLVAARSISSTGILVISINSGVFSPYFSMYSLRVRGFIMGLLLKDNYYLGFGLLSLVGLPLLPIFLPKMALLWYCLECSWALTGFLLLRFIVSALYYVKFIPRRMSSLISSNLGKVFFLIAVSLTPLL